MTGAPGVLAAALRADPPLDPGGDDARDLLRRELLRPEYNDSDLVGRFVDWLRRLLDGGVDRTADAPPVTAFLTMVVVVVLVGVLALLLSRVRRTTRAGRGGRDLFTGEAVSAAELRRRAEAALAEGRLEDAVVDGYRALALRQVERGRIDDVPGATAGEVGRALAAADPASADGVLGAARLFDEVLYGERPATRAQAEGVLALDTSLAGAR